MDWDELNFTEICRCCKRKEYGMTSIFNGNADSTYSHVQEMISRIASLNVQENDGLPSLVCTSCLNNIKNAYTFILQLILIDDELKQILLERGKLPDAPLQGTSTKSMKKENKSVHAGAIFENFPNSEDFHHSIIVKEEDWDEPMQNFYQHGSNNDNGYENIEVKVEIDSILRIEDEDTAENEPEMENANVLHLAPDEGTQQELKEDLMTNDDILKLIKTENIQAFEDLEEDYQNDNADGNSVDSGANVTIKLEDITKDERHQDNDEYMDESNSLTSIDDYINLDNLNAEKDFIDADNVDELCPQTQAKLLKAASNRANAFLMKCKLCPFTNAYMSNLTRHLQSHCTERPFACSKCIGTFKRRCTLMRHLRNCKSEIHKSARPTHPAKLMISITPEDLKDPEKIKEYYILVPADQVQSTSRDSAIEVYNCNLCAFTNTRKSELKQHLLVHCKDKRFECSKCNGRYSKKSNMQRHWQTCNGEIQKNAPAKADAKKIVTLTQEDLDDPLKMEKHYTVSKISKIDAKKIDDDEATVQSPSAIGVFKCNLCTYASARKYNLRLHLQRHCNDTNDNDSSPYTCSKCNGTFSQKDSMLSHRLYCVSQKFASLKRKGTKQGVSLAREDMNDPVKMMKYYTVLKLDVQNNGKSAKS